MPAASTINKALSALDGMEQIVRKEMLIHGEYVSSDVVNKRLAKEGAICGGRKYCAVGSLWAGAGVKFQRWGYSNIVELPGVRGYERDDYVARRPGLKLAYNTLNDVAVEYMNEHNLRGAKKALRDEDYDGGLECLFEGSPRKVNRDVMLTIINRARTRIKLLDVGPR